MGGISLTGEPDFMIHGVYQFTLFGQELWITTTTIGLLIISLFILILAIIANRHLRKASEVPDTIQNIVELAAEMLEKMIGSVMGKNGGRFFNYIGTIFLFILFCNIGGLFGLRTPTADFGVTFTLGIFTFLIVNYQGIKNRKIRHFTSLFEPFVPAFVWKHGFRRDSYGTLVWHDAYFCKNRYSCIFACLL